jgi:hypothetical protein
LEQVFGRIQSYYLQGNDLIRKLVEALKNDAECANAEEATYLVKVLEPISSVFLIDLDIVDLIDL